MLDLVSVHMHVATQMQTLPSWVFHPSFCSSTLMYDLYICRWSRWIGFAWASSVTWYLAQRGGAHNKGKQLYILLPSHDEQVCDWSSLVLRHLFISKLKYINFYNVVCAARHDCDLCMIIKLEGLYFMYISFKTEFHCVLFTYFFVLQNCSVGIVGQDTPFTIYDDNQVERYVSF